jgi:hypothetical protein
MKWVMLLLSVLAIRKWKLKEMILRVEKALEQDIIVQIQVLSGKQDTGVAINGVQAPM